MAQDVISKLIQPPARDQLTVLNPEAIDRLSFFAQAEDLEDLLRRAAITYVAPGDATRTGFPDNSIDIVYSYAVLEHVSERMIQGLLLEAARILRPGGIMASVIGTGDHYHSVDGSVSQVNFLKYPEWVWALLVKNKISYHNRLREKHFLALFSSYGARVVWKKSHIDPSDVLAAKTMRLNRRFAGMTAEELAISRVDVVIDFPRTA